MAIEALIARYGLAAIFLGAGIEGETCVLAGGVLAHRHLLPLWGVWLAAAAGSFVADQLFFAGGRYFRDHPRVRAMAAKPGFAKALVTLERHPVLFVMGFRFLYGLRTVSPIAIGTSHIHTRTFLSLNALAAAIWAALFTGIGYGFGGGIERLFGGTLSAGRLVPIAVVGIVLLLGVAQIVRWSHHRYADRCARASARVSLN
ncbi:MAG: VTT domain-containing protein [Candidatus Sphingomonas phytovorans]|nr:VTT domain-containing protein [Sphingomonas sp.]WEJ99185.1 MAG: VTT domain-containing protein [Sphingomonas sp.]